MSRFAQATFLAAAGEPAQLPPPGAREVVFAGRSNVGKSSAINAITGRRKLAFTSKTPGRTQTINFFSLEPGAALVDLPGYGYAKVPKPLQAKWQELIGAFLQSRAEALHVFVLMDARHPLTELDVRLLGWLPARRLVILLTKSDKLTRAEQHAVLGQVTEAVPLAERVLLFSSLNGQGVEEARDVMAAWLEGDAMPQNKKPPAQGRSTGGKTP